jgi:hypothetical protein
MEFHWADCPPFIVQCPGKVFFLSFLSFFLSFFAADFLPFVQGGEFRSLKFPNPCPLLLAAAEDILSVSSSVFDPRVQCQPHAFMQHAMRLAGITFSGPGQLPVTTRNDRDNSFSQFMSWGLEPNIHPGLFFLSFWGQGYH